MAWLTHPPLARSELVRARKWSSHRTTHAVWVRAIAHKMVIVIIQSGFLLATVQTITLVLWRVEMKTPTTRGTGESPFMRPLRAYQLTSVSVLRSLRFLPNHNPSQAVHYHLPRHPSLHSSPRRPLPNCRLRLLRPRLGHRHSLRPKHSRFWPQGDRCRRPLARRPAHLPAQPPSSST